MVVKKFSFHDGTVTVPWWYSSSTTMENFFTAALQCGGRFSCFCGVLLAALLKGLRGRWVYDIFLCIDGNQKQHWGFVLRALAGEDTSKGGVTPTAYNIYPSFTPTAM